VPVGQIKKPVQPLAKKCFSSHLPPNQRHNSRRLIPHEGTYPDRQTRWGGMRWTRQRRARFGFAGRASARERSAGATDERR
jgi:hypothetical protein